MTVRQTEGNWIAWTLDRSRVVARGRTLDAVKAAAAGAGERSVIVGRAGRRSHRFLYMFAVFIAFGQPLEPSFPVAASIATVEAGAIEVASDDR